MPKFLKKIEKNEKKKKKSIAKNKILVYNIGNYVAGQSAGTN